MRSLKVGGKLIWNQHLIIAEYYLEREGAFKHDGRHRMEILRKCGQHHCLTTNTGHPP